MIKSIAKRSKGKMEIDLTGPQGNAYCILGAASKLAKQLGKDGEAINKRMKEGDYEHLLEVFEEEFGDHVILWR